MVAVRAVNNSVGRKNSGIGNMNGGSTSGRRNGGTGNGRNTNGGATNGGGILTLLLPSLTPHLILVAFHMLVSLRNVSLAGQARPKAEGKKFGRPAVLTDEEWSYHRLCLQTL
jgi:hypothetical protein